ncbi:MAG: TonB-dependent receptor [Ignavibacteriales bacterium]|nr:TonB-dependent receptor [Ignavibacteriales bacterium]
MKVTIIHVCLLMIISVSIAFGGTTGKLAGRVTDRLTGEPLIGANVVIKSIQPNAGTSTDIDGYYHILNLPPGNYDVTISYIGYASTDYRISIKVDQTTELNVPLSTSTLLAKEVVIVGERTIVQRDKSSTIQRTDAEELASMPVNTLTGVLQLQTGVVNQGGDIHIRGGRSGEVGYYIDGYRVEDPLFNGNVIEINNQAIQEMELLSGTFNAEYGNALSGIVNIVTKDNTDKIKTNLSYKRTKVGIDASSDNLNERYIEGTFSAPLGEGSPFGVMISGKKVNADSYYFSGISQLTANGLQSVEFSKDNPYGFNDQSSLIGKFLWTPFSGAKVTLLDNYSFRKNRSYNHIMRFIPDSTYINESESNLIGLNFRHAVSNDLFYDIRLSYYQYSYLRRINGWSPDQYTFPSYSTFSNSLFYRNMSQTVYENQKTKSYSAKADMTWQIDRFNLVKAGFEFKSNDLDYYYIANPKNLTDQTVNIYRKKPFEGSLYAQDKIEFETIILNVGLRYDFFDPSTSFAADPLKLSVLTETKMKSSLSPRVGIAYPVRENMVFHFAYGQFFQRPEFQTLYNNLERAFANRGTTLFGSPALEPEKTSSYELGMTTSFGTGSSLQITFFSKKIENLIGVVWNYTPLAYAYYMNEDFASVKGLETGIKTRFHNFYFTANYTYSIAKGSSSTQQQRYTSVYNIVGVQSLKFLSLNFDQRHTANIQVALDFGNGEGPFGFLPSIFENTSIDLIGQYGSGLPYTFNPARAIYVAEPNNARLPERISFDLYARKSFKVGPTELGLFLDIRNLLNRKNIVSVYSATGSPDVTGDQTNKATPDYMQDPTNYASPRTIYVGIDIKL